MKLTPVVGMVLATLACVGPVSAAERRGTPQEVATSDLIILLADGTRLWLAEGVIVKHLPVGVTVKLSYEKREGKHVVTSIDVAE